MFSRMSSILTSDSASCWDPTTSLPPGFSKHTKINQTKISSSTRFTFESVGSYSEGTLVFDVERSTTSPPPHQVTTELRPENFKNSGFGGNEAPPPAYEPVQRPHDPTRIHAIPTKEQMRIGQLRDDEVVLKVICEARTNDESLQFSYTLETNDNHTLFKVVTPNTSVGKIASRLSFHITVLFPSSLTSVLSIETSGSQWRTICKPSLSSLFIKNLSLNTSNAKIEFDHLRTSQTTLLTVNEPILGHSLNTDSGFIKTCNGDISIRSIKACSSLNLITINNSIKGHFISGKELKIETGNAKIEGTFEADQVVDLKTSNKEILGHIRIGKKWGKKVEIKTSNAHIKAKIIIQDDQTFVRPSSLNEDEIDIARDSKSSSSDSTGFGDSGGRKLEIGTKTSNGHMEIEIEQPRDDLALTWEAKTSNGNMILSYAGVFEGEYSMSTSNGECKIQTPNEPNRSANRLNGKISTIGNNTGSAISSSSTITATTSNANASLLIK